LAFTRKVQESGVKVRESLSGLYGEPTIVLVGVLYTEGVFIDAYEVLDHFVCSNE